MGNPASGSADLASPGLSIEQSTSGNQNQTLGQMSGGTAIANASNVTINQADPEAIKRIVRDELRVANQVEYGEPVRRGLLALAELMKLPEARDSVVKFQVDFEAVCGQIEAIANYKLLHDLLHTLELQCYNLIIHEARRFPDDDEAVDSLMEHQMNLQDFLAQAQALAARETIAAREMSWLKELQQANSELEAAIEELDGRRLKRTIWLMNGILAIHPSQINTRLNAVAKQLRLPTLLSAMGLIWEQLQAAEVDGEKLGQFQTGMAMLSQLNTRLGALVIAHDVWQGVDLRLRLIETSLKTDTFELEMSWPDLQSQAQELFDPEMDAWTVAFQKTVEQLDGALASQNPTKVKSGFRRFRRKAGERFFQVDVTLKRLCEELREVGSPLATVLQMLE